jgi:hypothetical protein
MGMDVVLFMVLDSSLHRVRTLLAVVKLVDFLRTDTRTGTVLHVDVKRAAGDTIYTGID